VTGGPERYVDRGLIPRAISLVFSHIAGRTDASYTVRPPGRPCRVRRVSSGGAGPPAQVHVAYLEIYNEVAYDLLDAGREARALEDLPRVAVRADDAGAVRLGNLSVHRVASEEEALNLARRTPRAHLYLGALAASWCHSGAEPAAAGRASGGARAQLFLGDTNRTIAETPMNLASSRSHCIFTIHTEAREVRGAPAAPAPPTHMGAAARPS